MRKLTPDEMETHLNMSADNRETWEVFSDDPVMIRRLEKIAPSQGWRGQGKIFYLRADQVLLRKGKRKLSPEHKAALRDGREASKVDIQKGISGDKTTS